jgi:transposase-like protein
MKKYRYFSEEFKRALIAQIDSGAISKAAASREHSISPSLLDRWQQRIHEGTLQSRPSARERQLERELDRYKKKVGELTIQNELLKKLNETCASMRRSNGYVVTGTSTEQSKRGVK